MRTLGGTVRIVGAAAATTLLLAACANTPTGPAPASTPETVVTTPAKVTIPASTPSPTPTGPVPLSEDEARATYISIVLPMNEWIVAENETWDEYGNAGDWEALVDLAPGYAETYERTAKELLDVAWPEDIQPLIDELVSDFLAVEAAHFRKVADITTVAEANDLINGGTRSETTVNTEIRIRLNIEPEELLP